MNNKNFFEKYFDKNILLYYKYNFFLIIIYHLNYYELIERFYHSKKLNLISITNIIKLEHLLSS